MFLKEFSAAVRDFSAGFKIIQKLNLWNYFFIPVLIAIVVGILIFTSAYFLSNPIGLWLADFWPFDWGGDTVKSISVFMGGFLVIMLGLIVYKHLVMALSAPFMGPLSEKIEMHITGKPLDISDTAAEKMRLLIRGIRVNMRNLILELLISFPLFLLSFIPVLNLLTGFALLYTQWYFAGYGNLDYALERHYNFTDTKTVVRKHKGLAVGNGFIFHLLLMIPLVGIVLALPLSTAGATVSVVRFTSKKA
ncbi:MAG: EI24 domain-containing protein [Crocinitomicaceae bacterium]|nr:EI24 domain-containing protein [Crocinitomicaceae bacterium]MBK8927963.1 EI24 domain-containing protein [Crocinitomicaceae bacterium]